MPTTTDTVHGRIEQARSQVRAREATLAVALVAALAFGLLLLSDPTAHAALHDFRHTAGVVCH